MSARAKTQPPIPSHTHAVNLSRAFLRLFDRDIVQSAQRILNDDGETYLPSLADTAAEAEQNLIAALAAAHLFALRLAQLQHTRPQPFQGRPRDNRSGRQIKRRDPKR